MDIDPGHTCNHVYPECYIDISRDDLKAMYSSGDIIPFVMSYWLLFQVVMSYIRHGLYCTAGVDDILWT